jgi:hypothetical protein
MWLAIALITMTVLVLYRQARRDERLYRRGREFLLAPGGQKLLADLREAVESEVALADRIFDQALAKREQGSHEEARRLLDAGCQILERSSQDIVRLLAATTALSRLSMDIKPVRPLRPEDFRLPQVARLAHLSRLLQNVLMTPARFRLRIYLLGRSLAAVRQVLRGATRRILAEDARLDFATITDESLRRFLLRMLQEEIRHPDDGPPRREARKEQLERRLAFWVAVLSVVFLALHHLRQM